MSKKLWFSLSKQNLEYDRLSASDFKNFTDWNECSIRELIQSKAKLSETTFY